ncbi:hypothetical protein ACQVP2_02520 [Methylobacterium aquaticum]|uniref:hypothetical protein n=1 Tax=Methylobacterium aquaticum TaxID=270351 RepID=UPI003D169392
MSVSTAKGPWPVRDVGSGAVLAAGRRHGLAAVLGLCLAVPVAALAAFTVLVGYATHSRLPHQDEWGGLAVFQSVLSGAHPLADLFSLHNEHRSVVPRLITYSDSLVFAGSGYFSITVLFLLVLLTTGLLLDLHRRLAPKPADLAFGAVVPLLLFSLVQWENFGCGFQVEFVGVYAAACAAIVLYARSLARGPAGGPWLAAADLPALALVAVATLTMANGLLAGIVLVTLAVLARAGWRRAAAPLCLTLVLAAGYFADYVPPSAAQLYGAAGPPSPLDPASGWPERIGGTALFAAAYLGNFLDPSLGATILLGTSGLIAVTALAGRFALGRDTDPARLALLGIALFAAGSAVLTALGRYPYEGITGAMSSRYATGSAVFWCALLVAGWSVSHGLRSGAGLRLLIGGVCFVLAAASLHALAPTTAFLIERAATQRAVEDALLQDLIDRPAIRALYTDPDQVRAMTPFLRERAISIFATPDARRLGRPVEEAGRIAPEGCPGAFDAARRDADLGTGAVRVAGRAEARPWLPTLARVYVVNAAGRIVGFASTSPEGTDWSGAATAPDGELHAFLRTGSDGLCYLGTATVADGA